MKDEIQTITRRNLFATGGSSALVLAALAMSGTSAGAEELSATEKANVAIVDAFHKNMSDPAQNLDKLSRLRDTCSENIIWGTVNGQKTYGLPAVIQWYTDFFTATAPKGMRTMEYEYVETFAKGPVVVKYGYHFVIPPGGPKPPANNVHCTVHIVQDGKITERYDTSVRDRASA